MKGNLNSIDLRSKERGEYEIEQVHAEVTL